MAILSRSRTLDKELLGSGLRTSESNLNVLGQTVELVLVVVVGCGVSHCLCNN